MPNLPDPVGLNHCRVTGNFSAFVADGVDAETSPDWVAMEGTAEITPNIPFGKNYAVGEKSTFFSKAIPCTIDADGDLVYGGNKWIDLLASGPSISPVGFNYKIKFTLNLPGEENPTVYGPFDFDVVAGGAVDLADATPVPAEAGEPNVKGEQGNAGDLVGVAGPANVTGTVTLTEAAFPSTRLWTMTGNVTLALPTPSAGFSGTITLIITQDATGNRTITWPGAVKWPDGIAQQPAPAASTKSAIHLLWTGAEWLGLVGGKSFA